MDVQQLNAKIIECVSSPIQCKLMIEIMKCGEATARLLSESCREIPQTTLYRNLKRMTANGILKIVNETQIRGTVEKTYALAFDPGDTQSLFGKKSGEMYMQMFLQYILTFIKQFQVYCNTPDIDIEHDKSGFSLTHAYMTDDELEGAADSIAKILSPLQENKPSPDRKLRTIGVIFSPEHAKGGGWDI